MSEKGIVFGKHDAQQLGIRDELHPVPPSDRLPNGRRDLTKLPHKVLGTTPNTQIPLRSGTVLGEHDVSDEEKERARVIGTLVDEKGRIVSVQNPDRPLKLD